MSIRRTSMAIVAGAMLFAACGDSGGTSTTTPPVDDVTTTADGVATPGALQVGECVIGVGPGGEWLLTEAAMTPYLPFAGGYRTVVLDQVVGTVEGVVQIGLDPDEEEFTYSDGAELGKVDHPGAEQFNTDVMVGGTWDPTPRPVTFTDISSATYLDSTAAILDDLGIDGDPANRLVMRFDIEGDGKEEVLVIASSVAADGSVDDPEAPAYSVVYLRRLNAADEVETTVLASSESDGFFVTRYSVAGVFDGNGDGDLELVLEHVEFESGGKTFYEFDGSTYTSLADCGSGV